MCVQTVTLDGGEFRSLAGEFSKLRIITEEQWDFMEQLIRHRDSSPVPGFIKPHLEPSLCSLSLGPPAKQLMIFNIFKTN